MGPPTNPVRFSSLLERSETSADQARESEAVAWVRRKLQDHGNWKFGLDAKERKTLASLSDDECATAVTIIGETLNGSLQYWEFSICTKILKTLGSRAHAIVPILSQPKFLRHEHEGWRTFSIQVLGLIGPGAHGSIPLIKASLSDPERTVREAAEVALKQIESGR